MESLTIKTGMPAPANCRSGHFQFHRIGGKNVVQELKGDLV
ncbi:MAG: hypothetical protein AAB316_06900 [Bacteroidota bacterium]